MCCSKVSCQILCFIFFFWFLLRFVAWREKTRWRSEKALALRLHCIYGRLLKDRHGLVTMILNMSSFIAKKKTVTQKSYQRDVSNMFWSLVHVSFSARMVFRPNLWCCFTWWMYRELLVCAWNLGQAAELTDDFSDLIDRLSKQLVNARKYYASLLEGNTLLWLEMASLFFYSS